MKNTTFIIVFILTFISAAQAQDDLEWSPFLHQTGMYYSSDNITSEGFGLGVGIHLLHKSQLAGQADVNILWGNGNAFSSRFAAGYQRKGRWTPAVFGTLNLLWGHRTEFLSGTGQQPPVPVWIIGLRVTPLKFQTKNGFVSALEFGYGIGPDNGRSLELTILSIGLKF